MCLIVSGLEFEVLDCVYLVGKVSMGFRSKCKVFGCVFVFGIMLVYLREVFMF